MPNLLLMSSSKTPSDQRWLGHAETYIKSFLNQHDVGKVTFVPYAGVTISHEEYVAKARERFKEMGFELDSVHDRQGREGVSRLSLRTIRNAEAVVVGGGNTPKLAQIANRYCRPSLETLVDAIRERITRSDIPYMGWSAGAGFACPTIQTTNDWFIANPNDVSLRGLNLFPVNINPHYRDPVVITEEVRAQYASLLAQLYDAIPGLRDELENKGETRIDRINEFMAENRKSMLGLREGAIVRMRGSKATLEGTAGAKYFSPVAEPRSFKPGDELDFIS